MQDVDQTQLIEAAAYLLYFVCERTRPKTNKVPRPMRTVRACLGEGLKGATANNICLSS